MQWVVCLSYAQPDAHLAAARRRRLHAQYLRPQHRPNRLRKNDEIRTDSSHDRVDPPLTCQGPVMPGLTRNRRWMKFAYLATVAGAAISVVLSP